MSPLDDVGLSIVERPTPEVEAELVAACLTGDVAAQRALFRREYPRVNATIYRILGPTREVDDLVQETFIAAFRGLAKFRGESRLSTWIDRIAVRVAFDHVRTRSRVPVPLGLAPGAGLEDIIGGSIPDAQAHARDGLRRLYAALVAVSRPKRARRSRCTRSTGDRSPRLRSWSARRS